MVAKRFILVLETKTTYEADQTQRRQHQLPSLYWQIRWLPHTSDVQWL